MLILQVEKQKNVIDHQIDNCYLNDEYIIIKLIFGQSLCRLYFCVYLCHISENDTIYRGIVVDNWKISMTSYMLRVSSLFVILSFNLEERFGNCWCIVWNNSLYQIMQKRTSFLSSVSIFQLLLELYHDLFPMPV